MYNDRVTLTYIIHLGDFIILLFCLFVGLIIYVPLAIFQLNRDRSSWVEPVLSQDKCVLLKDHNALSYFYAEKNISVQQW